MLTSKYDGEPLPFLLDPHDPPRCLNLGTDWLLDIPINNEAPDFEEPGQKPLLISNDSFFLRLKEAGHYLDITKGEVVTRLPDHLNVVAWSVYSIVIPQPQFSAKPRTIFAFPDISDE